MSKTDHIIVKIEQTYISLLHIKTIEGTERVTSMRRAARPETLQGTEVIARVGELAAFLLSALDESDMQSKTLAIYLGAGAERFAEFRFNEAADSEIRKQRGLQTEQDLLADAADVPWRTITKYYNGADEGLSGGAVFAAQTEFCRRLTGALEEAGYRVTTISSSLLAFAKTAGLVSDIGEKVLVVSVEKKEIQAAFFIKGKLIRLTRFAQEEGGPSDRALQFDIDDTKVVLCGFESQDPDLREALRKSNALAVGSVNNKMKGAAANIVLSGVLAYQDALFPGVFSAMAFPGAPGAQGYLQKEQSEKRQHTGLVVTCAAVLAVALFICLVPPATLAKAENAYAANTIRLSDPFFADAAEKLAKHRLLVSEYTELAQAEEAVVEADPSYAGVIEEVKDSLLMTAKIKEMFYEKGLGVLVDFTTDDPETFDIAKNRLNDSRKMSIYEPSERVETEEGEWRIQIRITLTPSAWEAPQ
jgi:hypothetical protein